MELTEASRKDGTNLPKDDASIISPENQILTGEQRIGARSSERSIGGFQSGYDDVIGEAGGKDTGLVDEHPSIRSSLPVVPVGTQVITIPVHHTGQIELGPAHLIYILQRLNPRGN